MTAAKLDPALCDREWLDEAKRDAVAGFGFNADSVRKLLGHIAALEHGAPKLAPHVVGIGPVDTAIIDQALGYWSSDYNDAPHADIARIRALLCGTAPGSAPAQDGGGS